jgi:hypothetical protein
MHEDALVSCQKVYNRLFFAVNSNSGWNNEKTLSGMEYNNYKADHKSI